MNGHRLGTQSGPAAQNGYAAGFGRGVKPQKPGYATGPGSRALPAVVGAQPGLGLGGGAKSQKPGYGNGNGLGAQPGPAAQNGYRPGLGGGVKPQVPGFGNGKAHGLGTQPGPPAQNGYRAGPVVPIGYGPVSRRWRRHESSEARVQEWAGSRSLPGGRSPARSSARPGRECETSEARIPAREWAGSPARPGSGCEASEAKIWQWKWTGSPARAARRAAGGKELAWAHSPLLSSPILGPCNDGVPPLFLSGPPTPGVSLGKGGGWGLKPQPPPLVQSGKFPGYQPPNGYGPRAELGFGGGLKPQKIDFGYRNGGLRPEVFPEARPQPGFPGANGFGNGHGEEALTYPEAAAPDLEKMVRLWPFRALPGPPSSPGELPPSLSMQLEPGAPIQGWGASQGPMKS
ncbi:glycine rich extracellular protein 1 [Elephas maximus indicus]|uniref:glycine rich extracellular protein 1 n=1 Tax=Elephas maximus indicus TaxID=99487 RepID=UPI002116CB7D|nr:glycine rich extracellular protein 1 [Elephas maximus indicus]